MSFCSVVIRWEQPVSSLPVHGVVRGIAQNEADHRWERIRFVVRYVGSPVLGGPSVKFEKTLVLEKISANSYRPWFVEIPQSLTKGQSYKDEVVSIEVLDEYTFPRLEQLQEVLDEEQAAKREAVAAAAARQRAKEKRDRAEVDAIIKRTEAAEAKKRAELRAQCEILFGRTANKKVVDLTVIEAQAIETCKAFGFYRPR